MLNQSTRIATSTTTVVKATKGVLAGLFVGGAGATGPIITIYDNASVASGKVILTYTAPVLGLIETLDIACLNGIVVKTEGTTPVDITVLWR